MSEETPEETPKEPSKDIRSRLNLDALFSFVSDKVQDTLQEYTDSPPRWWNVIMLNDDVTRVEFVRHILSTLFRKTEDEITAILRDIHTNGYGQCGRYTYEVAETLVQTTLYEAAKLSYPLKMGVHPINSDSEETI